MRRILPLCSLLLALLPAAAHADSLTFTLDQTITWSIPLPLNGGALNANDLIFPFIQVDFNGHEVQGQLDLFTSAVGGGFNLTYEFVGGSDHIIGQGIQLFSGTTSDPTILLGNFTLTDGKGSDTLSITSDATTPTPELSTHVFLATGILSLLLLLTPKRGVDI